VRGVTRKSATLIAIVVAFGLGGCPDRAPVTLGCPADMALIPAGQVDSEWSALWSKEPPPVGLARAVPAFCIDRYEYPNRAGVVPLTHVCWQDAQRLCGRAGKRLCREDEWELACTMGRRWAYAYGPERVAQRCNADWPVGTKQAIAPSGSRAECRNSYGVFDLNGNVSEWVATTVDGIGGANGVLRGDTAWISEEYGGSCWSRHGHPLTADEVPDDGFRCCADPHGR
jgi:formylglycine-generating enzyme required for sulfatase activity